MLYARSGKVLSLILSISFIFANVLAAAPTRNSTHLKISEVVSLARFGGSVAIGDGVIFISEPTDFRNPGMVHIYERTEDGQWVHRNHITGPEARVGDRFGQSVAVLGSILFVADYANADGAVQLYRPGESGDYNHIGTLRGATGEGGQGFGASIAAGDGRVWIGAPGSNRSSGMVYVYRVLGDGESVVPESILHGDAIGDRFGSSLAATGRLVAIGSPGHGGGVGAIDIFSDTGGTWMKTGLVQKDSTAGRTAFGSILAIHKNHIIAGLPRSNGMAGGVEILAEDEDGMWSVTDHIAAPDSAERSGFGGLVTIVNDELWISAPMANGRSGSMYRYVYDESSWLPQESMADVQASPGDFFGGVVAVSDAVAVVSAPGDDYGLGSTYVFERTDDSWMQTAYLFREFETVEVPQGEQIDCTDGMAGDFDCNEIDLVSYIPNEDIGMNRGVRLNDVWGWTDPETGKEYALIGHMEAMVIMDVSDASNPVYLGTLPRTDGSPGNTWRDIKTFRDHAFIVADGSASHGVQIFDLTQLRDLEEYPVTFEETARYDGVMSVHNIVINEDTGYAYAVGSNSGGETCGGGLHMININDPRNPTFAGCFTDTTTGRNNSGATHDAQCVVYDGPDTEHRGKEICISSNGTAISIADVSDKDNPIAISTGSYPRFAYVHQGWLTEDHQYFYQNDEADELSGLTEKTRTMIWDLSDLDDPIMIKEYFGPTSATDHNLYVNGNYMYQTNNASGLRVIDVADPENPVEIGHFDTTPYGEGRCRL